MAAGILAGKAGETFQEIDGETNRVTIENVKTVGNIVTGRVAADKTKTLPGDIAGGIIGSAWGCDFSGCEFNGAVTSYADIGGIVGLGMDCTIRDSVANVALTLTDASKTAAEAGAGGIAGVFGISEENAAGMENCFANVTAPDNRVAGIFGIGKTGGDAAAPAFLPVMINCLYDGSPEVTRFTFVTMALPEGCGRVSVEDVTEPTVAPPFQWWWLIVGVAGGLVMSAAYILVHYKKNAMRSAVYVAAAKTTSKDETIVGEVPTRWQGIDAEKAELQGIINGFSDKEKTVAKLICDGYNRKQLAEKMGLAEGTVKYYIANILASANCTNRIEFISKFRGFFE
jgi:DNA-binding CsgD family transcriptional regulator